MLAAVLDGSGNLNLEDRPMPPVPPGEALVRVLLAGICSTDLELRAGYMGYRGVPGHEFVGRVEQGPAELVGRRVVGEINAACRDCPTCRAGLERHCPTRTVLGILGRDGAFAECLALPAANLHVLPDGLALERAVFVEPVAAAFEIGEQVAVSSKRALVMGAGKLGGLVARVLALQGARTSVLVRSDAAAARLAADGLDCLREGAHLARGWDLVVEATGSPEGLPRALELVRPRGTVVLKTTCAATRPLNLAPVVIHEVTLVGSRCGPFAPALDALARGLLQPERGVAARFRLADVHAAFEAAAGPARGRKVLLEP